MCNCVAEMNELLAPKNTRLTQGFHLIGSHLKVLPVLVATEKIVALNRGKATIVVATYCPFCGNKYPDLTENES